MSVTPSQAVAAIRCICRQCRRATDNCENCKRARRAIHDASTSDNKWLPDTTYAPPDWLRIRYVTLLKKWGVSPLIFGARNPLYTKHKIRIAKALREPGPLRMVASTKEIANVLGYASHTSVVWLLAQKNEQE